MQNATKQVREALACTPREYLKRCCAMRAETSETRMGSFLPGRNADQVEEILRTVYWEPYTHASIEAPAQGFIAPSVPGAVGMVAVMDLPEDAALAFDDSKDTGFVEVVWTDAPANAGHRVDFLVALVGPGDDGRPQLYTFFPGDPVPPSRLPRAARVAGHEVDRHGKQTTKSACVDLGIDWVKLS